MLVVDEHIHQSNNNIAVGVALPSCITPPVPSQSEEEEEQVEYLTELETREQDEEEEVQPVESVDHETPPVATTLTTLVQVLPSGYDWLASEEKEESQLEEAHVSREPLLLLG